MVAPPVSDGLRTKKQGDSTRHLFPSSVASRPTNTGQLKPEPFLPMIASTKVRQAATGNNLKSFYVKSGMIDKASRTIEELQKEAIAKFMQQLPEKERQLFLPPIGIKPDHKPNTKQSHSRGSKNKYFTEGISALSQKPSDGFVVDDRLVKPENLPSTISMARENGQVIISLTLQERKETPAKKKPKKPKKTKQKQPGVNAVQLELDADYFRREREQTKTQLREKRKPSQQKDGYFMRNMESLSSELLPDDERKNKDGKGGKGKKGSDASAEETGAKPDQTQGKDGLSVTEPQLPKLHEIKIGDGLLINHFVFGMRHGMIFAKRIQADKAKAKQLRAEMNKELAVSKKRVYEPKFGRTADLDKSFRQQSSLSEQKRLGHPHVIELKPRPLPPILTTAKSPEEKREVVREKEEDIELEETPKTDDPGMSDTEQEPVANKPPKPPNNGNSDDTSPKPAKPTRSPTKKLPRSMRPSPSPPMVPPNTAEQNSRANNDEADDRPFKHVRQTPEITLTPAPEEDLISDDESTRPNSVRQVVSKAESLGPRDDSSRNSFLGVPTLDVKPDTEKMIPPRTPSAELGVRLGVGLGVEIGVGLGVVDVARGESLSVPPPIKPSTEVTE